MDCLSIIICTYNGASRIKWVCQAITNQIASSASFEVILVDNNSTDNVSAIFTSELAHLDARVVVEKKQGLMHARKAGIKAAKYQLVSFIDDDNYISPDWVIRVLDIFKDPLIGALGGRSCLTTDSTSIPQWFSMVQGAFAIGEQGRGRRSGEKVPKLYGAGLSLRKDILLDVYESGYESLLEGRKGDALLSGEDSEICELVKLSGLHCHYSSSLTLYHLIPSRRLDESYVLNLYASFGIAFIGLLPLRFMTDYKFIPKFLLTSKFFLATILTFKLVILHLMSSFRNNKFYASCQISMYKAALLELRQKGDFHNFVLSKVPFMESYKRNYSASETCVKRTPG